jgi:hypothetical protein
MTFKEIFNINNIFNGIILESSENHQNQSIHQKYADAIKRQNEKFTENEWNQEYEIIYLSYILER